MIAQTNERANIGALNERDFDGTKLHRVTVLDGCKCSASHMGGKCKCDKPPFRVNWAAVGALVSVVSFWTSVWWMA